MKSEHGDDPITLARLRLRNASGNRWVKDDRLVAFLYILLRDHLTAGVVQSLLETEANAGDVSYTNGFLLDYAQYVAGELRKEKPDGQA